MTPEKIKETLISFGYKLSDRGSYWQTNAIYRNGDNNTALQIYKDTGVWKDHVEQTSFMPFEKLVQVTLGTNDTEEIKKYISKDIPFEFSYQVGKKIVMEKTYSKSILDKLLPHYDFYNKKGISSETLKLFKGGLATNGKMFQRFVFPIFNSSDKIHGFSGRSMIKDPSKPKWKHIGYKSKWIYPRLLSEKSIIDSGSVYIVESIGDLLSLYESGNKNILCSFGVGISPSLISYLVGLNPKKIFISFNNDSLSDNNAGLNGALKSFLKLTNYFDPSKVFISLPFKNDFGDMNTKEINDWFLNSNNIEKTDHDLNILKQLNSLFRNGVLNDSAGKSFKKFKKTFDA